MTDREQMIAEIRNWLIQRQEDLPLSYLGAREMDTAFLLEEIDLLQQERDRLIEGLQWYADNGNWVTIERGFVDMSVAEFDSGEKANTILKELGYDPLD